MADDSAGRQSARTTGTPLAVRSIGAQASAGSIDGVDASGCVTPDAMLPGIASSFATTLLVFGSLAFITGEIGQILRVLPIVLIMVLTVSLVEAFLILPNHLSHSLERMEERRPSRFRQGFEAWLGFSSSSLSQD